MKLAPDIQRPSASRPRRPRTRRRGVILVLTGFCLVALFAFVALSVDAGRMVLTGTKMQNAVDAAARQSCAAIGDPHGGLHPMQRRVTAGCIFVGGDDDGAGPTQLAEEARCRLGSGGAGAVPHRVADRDVTTPIGRIP